MTLGDLASFIGGKIGLTDSATLTKIKGFATERYKAIYAGALWKDALSVYTLTVAADQHTVILPAHVAHFVAAKFDKERLVPVDTSFLFASDPELWDRAGTPTHCSELAPSATKVLPKTGGEQLRFVSSSAADTAKDVLLHGEGGNGEPFSEKVTLNGLTPVDTAAAGVGILYGLSKGTTTGSVSCIGVISGFELVQLLPTENQRLHRRLRLHSVPTQEVTLMVLGKRHAGPFTNDNDATALPSLCDQALQALVHGDALEWMRQYGKANNKYAEGLALIEQAKRSDAYQAAPSLRMVPGDPIAEGCSPYDFL